MKSYEKLRLENKAWAQEQISHDPTYFSELSKGQSPGFLWIGCSDSRVPPGTILNLEPGDAFVHRNIANLVVPGDLNLLSVLQYSVQVLKVDHVIVCGHTGCGGVKAAIDDQPLGLIDAWLENIKQIRIANKAELDTIEDPKEKVDKLVELNVKRQIQNLSETTIIQQEWRERSAPCLHGWVYDLNTGLIKDIYTLDCKTD